MVQKLIYVKPFTTVAFEKQGDLNFFTIKYSDGAYAVKIDYWNTQRCNLEVSQENQKCAEVLSKRKM